MSKRPDLELIEEIPTVTDKKSKVNQECYNLMPHSYATGCGGQGVGGQEGRNTSWHFFIVLKFNIPLFICKRAPLKKPTCFQVAYARRDKINRM